MKKTTPEFNPQQFNTAAEIFDAFKDQIIMIKGEPWKVTGASTMPEKAVILHLNQKSGEIITPQMMLLDEFLKQPRKLPK